MDTALERDSSVGKVCVECNQPIDGDQRYSRCAACRSGDTMPQSDEPVSQEMLDVGPSPLSLSEEDIQPLTLDVVEFTPPPI